MAATALVTGASSGIGMELARILAREGIDLILVARRRDILADLKRELESTGPIRVVVMPHDLASPAAVAELHQQISAAGLIVDILVNNAGFGQHGPFLHSDWSRNRDMIAVNITSLVHLTHLFGREMVSRGRGRILNVASTAAFQPGPFMAVYYASKSFVLSFGEALANELQGTGVTLTTLCPGPTRSGFQAAAGLEGTRLFSVGPVPSAREVAEYAWQAMMKGRRIAVHGWKNRILVVLVRLLPRRIVLSVVRRLQETRH